MALPTADDWTFLDLDYFIFTCFTGHLYMPLVSPRNGTNTSQKLCKREFRILGHVTFLFRIMHFTYSAHFYILSFDPCKFIFIIKHISILFIFTVSDQIKPTNSHSIACQFLVTQYCQSLCFYSPSSPTVSQ